MNIHQILRECAENLMLLTQLGLSVAVPPLLCLYAANWLRTQFALGLWVMVLALLLGVASGISSFWKVWVMVQKRGNKRKKP